MDPPRSVSFLMSLALLYPKVVSSDGVRVIRGRPAVLQCDVDPGDTLLIVTWKLYLYNSYCIISHNIEDKNTNTSYNNCSTRMRSDDLSLSISDTEISDGGHYNCMVANDTDTIIKHTVLQVLAEPFIFLKLNDDGSPECGAIGGNPPAEISWIPHSDDINTTIVEEPDQTWTVISTFSRKRMNETSVTCVVSHPTFVNPWKGDIGPSGYNRIRYINLRIIFTVIFIVLFAGLLLYLKIKCQEQNIPGVQINED